MSEKKLDRHNRWRGKTVAFRMSPQEDEQLDAFVRLSGLTKQDYLICRALQQDVVICGNPRVFKALRNQLAAVLGELQRLEQLNAEHTELLEIIHYMAVVLDGLQEETHDR